MNEAWAAITPTTMSIQFWPWKPRTVKGSTRNLATSAPQFLWKIGGWPKKYIIFILSGLSGAVRKAQADPRYQGCIESLAELNCGAKRQQLLELGRMVTFRRATMMKTCQPSSARASALAIATTTLKRIVVVTSSPRDACTMKVTATPHLRDARCRDPAISVPALASALDRNPGSSDNPFRKSSSASFPAS
jgi:hypothetical protein